MTQIKPAQFATPEEVAALIGVEASTLPTGPALVEDAVAVGEYFTDTRNSLQSFIEAASAYVWRDHNDKKICEVRISRRRDVLNYQRIDYDAEERITQRYELLLNGRVGRVFYEAGFARRAEYDAEYGISPGVRYEFYDESGKLHNLSGFARYYIVGKYKSRHQEEYYIHGVQYSKEPFNAHPERIAYLEQKRQAALDAKLSSRLKRAVAKVCSRKRSVSTVPIERKATLRSDVLIDIAVQLSDAEKLRLLKAISPTFNDESRPAVASATVTIHAPKREFKAARSSSQQQ